MKRGTYCSTPRPTWLSAEARSSSSCGEASRPGTRRPLLSLSTKLSETPKAPARRHSIVRSTRRWRSSSVAARSKASSPSTARRRLLCPTRAATLQLAPIVSKACRCSDHDPHAHGTAPSTAGTGTSSTKQNMSTTRLAAGDVHGRQRDAAVAGDDGGHAVLRRRIEAVVPPHRAVVVGVDVDEPGCHERARGVDRRFAVGAQVGSDLGDQPVAHADVAPVRRPAGAVHDRAASNQQITHVASFPRSEVRSGVRI